MHGDESTGERPAPPGAPSGRGKVIRDAVHKDIHLSAAELRLLDTPPMQRLRGIRQLGAAFYVYPAAQHSRFEHCVGTCWMARKIVSSIESAGAFQFPEVEKRAIFLASLAHDVTHIPFGHTFEDERKLLPRHDRSEKRYAHFLHDSELGEVLHASEAGRLALEILHPDLAMPPERRYLRQIVSGTIGADLLDYLKRDNYFCGLSQEYDDRVFRYFAIADGELVLELHHQGLFRRDALSEITNLLRIRYVLSERVYYHHAKIACGVMISKAIESAFEAGLEESDLYELTDDALPFYLEQRCAAAPGLRELLGAFRTRRLFKRCYMLSRGVGEEVVGKLVEKYRFNTEGERTVAEAQIAGALGAEPHQVAIYCPSEEMALKEADMPVTLGRGRTMRFAELNTAEMEGLRDQHRALWRFYVFVSRRLAHRLQEAGDACEEVIGLPNELPHEMRGRAD